MIREGTAVVSDLKRQSVEEDRGENKTGGERIVTSKRESRSRPYDSVQLSKAKVAPREEQEVPQSSSAPDINNILRTVHSERLKHPD